MPLENRAELVQKDLRSDRKKCLWKVTGRTHDVSTQPARDKPPPDKMLGSIHRARFCRREHRRVPGVPGRHWEMHVSVVYTIGYESTDISRFVKTLKAVGIKRLADVRAVAVSRKAGFSKKGLAARLDENGIEYSHFVALGDPKPGRDAARAGNFKLFRAIYGKQFRTSEAQEDLRKLLNFVRAEPTCLLCFERNPRQCHRNIVANRVVKETGYTLCDLFAEDPDRYVRNAKDMPRYYPCESVSAA